MDYKIYRGWKYGQLCDHYERSYMALLFYNDCVKEKSECRVCIYIVLCKLEIYKSVEGYDKKALWDTKLVIT